MLHHAHGHVGVARGICEQLHDLLYVAQLGLGARLVVGNDGVALVHDVVDAEEILQFLDALFQGSGPMLQDGQPFLQCVGDAVVLLLLPRGRVGAVGQQPSAAERGEELPRPEAGYGAVGGWNVESVDGDACRRPPFVVVHVERRLPVDADFVVPAVLEQGLAVADAVGVGRNEAQDEQYDQKQRQQCDRQPHCCLSVDQTYSAHDVQSISSSAS